MYMYVNVRLSWVFISTPRYLRDHLSIEAPSQLFIDAVNSRRYLRDHLSIKAPSQLFIDAVNSRQARAKFPRRSPSLRWDSHLWSSWSICPYIYPSILKGSCGGAPRLAHPRWADRRDINQVFNVHLLSLCLYVVSLLVYIHWYSYVTRLYSFMCDKQSKRCSS